MFSLLNEVFCQKQQLEEKKIFDVNYTNQLQCKENPSQVNDSDHLVTIQLSAGNSYECYWDKNQTRKLYFRPKTSWKTHLIRQQVSFRNGSNMTWTWQWAQGIDHTSNFPRATSNWAFVGCDETMDGTEAPTATLQDLKDPLQMSRCQIQQDTLWGLLSLSLQVRDVLVAREGPVWFTMWF